MVSRPRRRELVETLRFTISCANRAKQAGGGADGALPSGLITREYSLGDAIQTSREFM